MFSNVHQLLYLCIDVRNLGPVWTHSCSPFEDKNRFILQLIHGSQKIEFQLNSAINIVQSIPTVVEQTISKDPLLMSFYESMNRQKCVPVAQPFSPNLHILGKIIEVDMRADISALLSDYLSSVPLSQRLFSFNRMLYSGEIFHAKSYQRVSRRDSTVICYSDNNEIRYGSIQLFLMYKELDITHVFLKMKEFTILQFKENSHIVIVDHDNYKDKLITQESIIYKMLCVDFSGSKISYLIRFPNKLECR